MRPADTEPARPAVYTNKARCRDCYRCLRACPVKAIRVVNGQASVVTERCLSCGTCVRECPQQAKSFRQDVARAAALLGEGVPVAASIAPAFAALYGEDMRLRLAGALARLGFAHVSETAIGAAIVARATAALVQQAPERPHITTACPAAVSYIEQRAPGLVRYLTPVVSPMIAHALRIKEILGPEAKVVFIGPCVAKKAEADRMADRGAVDVVLTFEELDAWLAHAGIDLATSPERPFDVVSESAPRYFPLPGGLARTAGLDTDSLARDCVAPSGIGHVHDVLESLKADPQPVLVEPLFCANGCINGAGVCANARMFDRRRRLIDYAASEAAPVTCAAARALPVALRVDFAASDTGEALDETAVQEALARMGKQDEAARLNCGACGYESCRDQAEAVVRGLAQPDMCIPHMRRLAEQRSDKIFATSPNGILVLDERLRILHMNPSFRTMFAATDGLLGQRVDVLMDPEPFERLVHEGMPRLELTVDHARYNRICRHILYPLPEDRQLVAILVDITSLHVSQEELGRLRTETVEAAEKLMAQQFAAAREIAVFLGQSTARSEEMIRKLRAMASEEPQGTVNRWLWDTSTTT